MIKIDHKFRVVETNLKNQNPIVLLFQNADKMRKDEENLSIWRHSSQTMIYNLESVLLITTPSVQLTLDGAKLRVSVNFDIYFRFPNQHLNYM